MRPETISFSWSNVTRAEMGVVIEDGTNSAKIVGVPIKDSVQDTLKEMLSATYSEMLKVLPTGEFPELELAQIYEPKTALFVPASTDFVNEAMTLHALANLPTAPNALDFPEDVRMYFAIFRDPVGKKLVACRRAVTFKGLVKRKIFFWKANTLAPAESPVFALDHVFDYIIAEEGIFVLHPGQFSAEAVDNKAICKQSADALPAMESRAKFIKFSALDKYVREHPMAAKLLASIRQRRDLDSMSPELVKGQFAKQGIPYKEDGGMVVPEANHEMDFLKLLDRRLYDLELVAGQHELYAAGNRTPRTASAATANKSPTSPRSARPRQGAPASKAKARSGSGK